MRHFSIQKIYNALDDSDDAVASLQSALMASNTRQLLNVDHIASLANDIDGILAEIRELLDEEVGED